MLDFNFANWPLWYFKKMERYFDPIRLLEAIGAKYKKPKRIFFWGVPQSLNGLEFGQRISLMMAYERGDVFGATYKTLTKIPTILLPFLPVRLTFPFVAFVIEDLKARNKRDEVLIIPLTPEQQRAGLDKMNHGWFGVIDSLAQRLHCKHEDIEKLPDNRVFRMRKIDVDQAIAQRRLIEQSNRSK